MKDFPYKISFANIVLKPMVSEAKDKLLALASLAEVSKFIPNIDTAQNGDLLPVAFNACVVNRGNKNTDIIDTATALAIYKNFINKPVNIEHHKQKVIGAIINAGFSEFGTDKPLSEADVKDRTDPFNITLGAVIWRAVAPELSELIEDSSDPTSLSYQSVSASWELGFEGYKIALMDGGKKNLSQASRIIDDPEEVKKVQNKLISLGGDGKIDDLFAFRMPFYSVLPLGVALTERPAAEVKGVATAKTLDVPVVGQVQSPAVGKPAEATEIKETAKATTVEISENKISQEPEKIVKTNRKQPVMKITSLTDISEASLKDVDTKAFASAVGDFIQSRFTEHSAGWATEKQTLENKIKTAEAAAAKATELETSLAALKLEVETLKKEKNDREGVDKFNARMTEVAASYDLDDDARAAIVEDIKAIASDEAFVKWQTRAKVLLKGYAKKAAVPADKDKEKKDDKKDDKDAKASVADKVDQAFDKDGKPIGGLPNGTSGTRTISELAKLAFANGSVIVTK